MNEGNSIDIEGQAKGEGAESHDTSDPVNAQRENDSIRMNEQLKESVWRKNDDLNKSTTANRSQLIFFLLAMAYFLIIIASTKDLQLLLPDSMVRLPILGVDLDLIRFYQFAPIIIILLHFNLLFSLCQYSRKLGCLGELIKKLPKDDDPLQHSSFIINLLLRPKNRTPKADDNERKTIDFRYYLIRFFLYIIVCLFPLLILVMFQWRFAKSHDFTTTSFHFFYIAIDVALLSYFWIRISRPAMHAQYCEKQDSDSEKKKEKNARKRGRVLQIYFSLQGKLGGVNMFVIGSLVLVQVYLFLIFIMMNFKDPDNMYRFINDWDHLVYLPRMKIVGQPIVDHHRKLSLPLPYSDSVESLKKPLEKLNKEDGSAKESNGGKAKKTCIEPQEKNPNDLCQMNIDMPISKENQLDLSGRDLRFAILNGSDLTGVKLDGAQLQGASLEDVKLDHAEMNNVQLQGANLRNAMLRNTILGDAHFEEAMLERACMKGAEIENASFNGADMTFAKLNDAILLGTSFEGAILHEVNFTGSEANRAKFRAADLTGADLRDVKLNGANFHAANLSSAKLGCAILVDASMQAANLDGASLYDAKLLGANMHAVNLKSAYLTQTNLTGANLRYAHIKNTDIKLDQLDGKGITVYGLSLYMDLSEALHLNGESSEIDHDISVLSSLKDLGVNIFLNAEDIDNIQKERSTSVKDAENDSNSVAANNQNETNEAGGINSDDISNRNPGDSTLKPLLSKSEGESINSKTGDQNKEKRSKDKDRIDDYILMLEGKEIVVIHKDSEEDILGAQRTVDFDFKELVYRLRSEIVCENIYLARGVVRQHLFDEGLEFQRRRLFDHLRQNCPQIFKDMELD